MTFWQGFNDIILYLKEHGASLHPTTNKGATPLSLAAKRGRTRAVKLLLGLGAKPDGQTLYLAFEDMYELKDNVKAHIQTLKETAGATATVATKEDIAAILAESEDSEVDLVNLLIAYGATVNCTDEESK